MLDCELSFLSVSEFASSRRPLSARLMSATALAEAPDGPDTARKADGSSRLSERQVAETFTPAAPVYFDSLPASEMPPLPLRPGPTHAQAAGSTAGCTAAPHAAGHTEPDAAGFCDMAAVAAPDAPAAAEDIAAAPSRGVTPRRPMRLTAARSIAEAAPIARPSFNLFDGVFEDDSLDGPDVDPRLQRSRARARARLIAAEAALSPVERNLWHDDVPAVDMQVAGGAEPAVAPQPQEARTLPGPTPRRPARHLSLAELSRRVRPLPAPQDPLRERLCDLRAILYAPDPEGQAPMQVPITPPPADQGLLMAFARQAVLVILALLSVLRDALPGRGAARAAAWRLRLALPESAAQPALPSAMAGMGLAIPAAALAATSVATSGTPSAL